MAAYLLLLRNRQIVSKVLLGNFRLRLGRAPENDIVIDDESVSRFHAEIVPRATAQYELRDLESRNGTWVNGDLLLHENTVLLTSEDMVVLAMSDIVIKFVDDQATIRVRIKRRGITIDEGAHEVYLDGKLIKPPLTLHQYDLLLALSRKGGGLCSRDEIVQAVWPDAKGGVSDEMIDALIKRLRKRLGDETGNRIITVPRHGFKLNLTA